MTHFWKDSELPDAEPPSIWLWGKYVAPVVYDLAETMMQLWEQTCVPAFKAFGYMTLMVVKTCFLSRFEGIGTATAQYHRAQKMAAQESKDRNARTLANTHRLSSQSEMHLRKIQGAIGDNWSAATHLPLHPHRGKAERWENSRRKHSTHVASNPWQSAQVANRAQSSNAPAEHEDIMGLDDIFNRPVSGMFLDDAVRASQPNRRDGALAKGYNKAAREISEHPALKKDLARPAAAPKPSPVARAEHHPSPLNGQPVYAQASSSSSDAAWSDATDSDGAFGTTSDDGAHLDTTHWTDAIPELPTSPYTPQVSPSASYSQPGNPPASASPAKPVVSKMSDDVPPELLETDQSEYPPHAIPWFAEECENPLAALTHAPASDVPWLAPPEQLPTPAPKQPAPPKPVIRPVEKKAPPPLPKPLPPAKPPEPLRLDHELEEDLNGFDYMVQNNRILSNSISNLVDSYFRKASLEEDPNLY